jgi:hypothetical protein
MQRREIRMLESKLRNTKDKKEVVVRERKLLNERIESLIKVRTPRDRGSLFLVPAIDI